MNPVAVGRVAEAVRAQHGSALDEAALPEPGAPVHGDAREQPRARADPDPLLELRAGADHDLLAELRAWTDDRQRTDRRARRDRCGRVHQRHRMDARSHRWIRRENRHRTGEAQIRVLAPEDVPAVGGKLRPRHQRPGGRGQRGGLVARVGEKGKVVRPGPLQRGDPAHLEGGISLEACTYGSGQLAQRDLRHASSEPPPGERLAAVTPLSGKAPRPRPTGASG